MVKIGKHVVIFCVKFVSVMSLNQNILSHKVKVESIWLTHDLWNRNKKNIKILQDKVLIIREKAVLEKLNKVLCQ